MDEMRQSNPKLNRVFFETFRCHRSLSKYKITPSKRVRKNLLQSNVLTRKEGFTVLFETEENVQLSVAVVEKFPTSISPSDPNIVRCPFARFILRHFDCATNEHQNGCGTKCYAL